MNSPSVTIAAPNEVLCFRIASDQGLIEVRDLFSLGYAQPKRGCIALSCAVLDF